MRAWQPVRSKVTGDGPRREEKAVTEAGKAETETEAETG